MDIMSTTARAFDGAPELSLVLLDHPFSQSPLGAPLSQGSASFLAQDPIAWHLQYWLSIGTVGIIRGEDPLLMLVRINIEFLKLDPDLSFALHPIWNLYWKANSEECKRRWAQISPESEEAKFYLDDISRMLVNKGLKTRKYLHCWKMQMMDSLEAGSVAIARMSFDELGLIYQKLQEEEEAATEAKIRFLNTFSPAEAEAITRTLNDINDERNRRQQEDEAAEAKTGRRFLSIFPPESAAEMAQGINKGNNERWSLPDPIPVEYLRIDNPGIDDFGTNLTNIDEISIDHFKNQDVEIENFHMSDGGIYDSGINGFSIDDLFGDKESSGEYEADEFGMSGLGIEDSGAKRC